MKNMQYIEEIIIKNMQNMHTPGLSLAVIGGPEICYIQGFGANHSQMPEQKVTPETLFCVGSVTKPLVATAIMRLVEQNKLNLDESIVRYLPFPVRDELTSITMRMLLAHTAGFPTVSVPVNQKKAQSLEAFVQETLALLQLVAPPGKLHYYSNLGYIVAGYIIEHVSRKPFASAMQMLVFEPLAMTKSTFAGQFLAAPLALPHEVNTDGTIVATSPLPANPAGNPAGLALSTATDLAQFLRFLLNQSSHTFLSTKGIEEMSRPQVALYTPMEYNYGLGLFTLNFKGERCLMHLGSMMSYICEFRCFPARNCAVVALSNFCDAPKKWRIVAEICTELLDLPKMVAAPKPIAPVKDSWPAYEGLYHHIKYGYITIKQQNENLYFQRGEQSSTSLRAFKEHVYMGADGKDFVCFIPEESGPVQYIVVNELPFQRVLP